MIQFKHGIHSMILLPRVSVILLCTCVFFSGCGVQGKNEKIPRSKKNEVPEFLFDVTWVPEKTELVVQIDVEGILSSPLLKQSDEEGNERLAFDTSSFDTGLGIDIAEIKKITIGVAGVSELDAKSVKEGEAAFDPLKESSVVIFECIKHVNADDIAKLEGVTPALFEARRYYRRKNDNPDYPPLGIYLPDDRFVVVGPEKVIQRILQIGPGQVNPLAFNFVDPQSHFAISFVPNKLTNIKAAQLPPGLPGELSNALAQAQSHGDRFGLELFLKNNIDLSIKVHCESESEASVLGEKLQAVAQLAKQAFTSNQKNMGMLAQFLEPLATNLIGQANETTAELSTNLPQETAQLVAGMAPMLMMMSGLGGMGGGDMQMSGGVSGEDIESLLAKAVDAARVKGLPADSTLKAAIGWSNTFVMSGEGGIDPPEELQIDFILQGDEYKKTIAYGELMIEQAKTDSGQLRQQGGMSVSGDSLSLNMLDRESLFTPMPEDGVLMTTTFHHPVPTASIIEELTGELTVLIADQQTSYTLTDVLSVAKNGTLDKALQQAGVKLSVEPSQFEGASPQLILTCPAEAMITKLKVLDADGNEDDDIWPQAEINPDGSSRYQLGGNEADDLDKANLTFVLNTKIQRIDTAFTFTDLKIPPVEKLPSDEQLALVTWIPSESKAEIPNGMQVVAQAHWSSFTNYGSDGKPKPRNLEIGIDLMGGPALNTIAIGKYKVDTATTDVDNLVPAKKEFGNDPYDKLVNYNSIMFLTNEPVNGAQAVFTFQHPGQLPKRIKEFSGQFQLVTSPEEKIVHIPDVLSKIESGIEHPELTEHGVTLTPRKAGDGFHLEVTSDNPLTVGDIELVDLQGVKLRDVYPGKSEFDGKLTYTFLAEGKLPEDAGMNVILNLDIKEHTIPFTFKNLSVPNEPPADEF